MAENSSLLNSMYVFSMTRLDVQVKVFFSERERLEGENVWLIIKTKEIPTNEPTLQV